MNRLVLDSCVVAKWVLPESDSVEADLLLAEVESGALQVVALDIAFAEVANAIWKRFHRGLASEAECTRSLRTLLRSPVHIEPARRFLWPAMSIAIKFDRSIYDSLFVAAVQELGLQGITTDEPLIRVIGTDYPQVVLLRDRQP